MSGIGEGTGNHQDHQCLQHEPLEAGIEPERREVWDIHRVNGQCPGLLECSNAFADEHHGQQGQE